MTFAWIVDGAGGRHVELAEAVAANGSADFVWFHLDGRQQESLEWLAARVEIPEIARNALVAEETRPRSEPMGEGALINLRALGKTPEDDPDALVSVRMWAQRGSLISVCFRTPVAIDTVCHAVAAGLVRDPGDLISEIATAISRELDPEVAELGDMLDDCETAIEAQGVYRMRRQIARARAKAIAFRRFLVPQRQALERLATLPADWLEEQDRMHLREAADRCARMAEELEAVRERAALMHEELTDLRAELMDSRALMISIVALIFLPLTFITGLLGMNVKGIPFAEAPWAFWGVVGICVVIGLAISGWFAARHWLGR
jgi:zinc transporter